MMKCCLLLLVPLSHSSAAVVEGPFKSSAPTVDLTEGGIWLTYRVSSRTSTNWIDCVRANGSPIRVCVDTGLAGCGVEAYLSLTEEVVVLDTKTKQTLWMRPVGAWYHILSFAAAKDTDTGREIKLLRVGGADGFGRFFEVRTGLERFLEIYAETLIAREEPRRELRGQPVKVLKSFVGKDSKIAQPRCERITTKEGWLQLWKEHAGGGGGSIRN